MQMRNVRFIIVAITTFSAYAVYVSRVNLSIAIIAMVEDQRPMELGAPRQQANLTANREAGGFSTSAPPQPPLYQSAFVASVEPSGDGEQLHSAPARPAGQPAHPYSSLVSSENNEPAAPGSELLVSAPGDTANLAAHRDPPALQSSFFPASKESLKTPLISQEKFDWDLTEQGLILSAFFYGYILFQIPGARMAEQNGAKWIILAASAGSAVISLLFPLTTQLNSIYLLMVLRFIMGLCQSAFFPAAYALFCRWLPERERSVLLPMMFIGNNLGNISTYIMSSYLISSNYGWPSVFYLSGLVCLSCSTLWCIFGSNGPEDNWLITDEERRYIISSGELQASSESSSLSSHHELQFPAQRDAKMPSKGASLERRLAAGCQKKADEAAQARRPLPAAVEHEPSWPKLIKSVPVWVLILTMYGNEWSQVVICYELPTYLNTAMRFPINQNGVINSFIQLCFALFSPLMSLAGAFMLDRHFCGMRKIHVRKLFQSMSTFGQAVCFLAVPFCGSNRALTITVIFLAVFFKSCCNAGDIMVPGDLSPEYSGTIFAFANSIGNTAGFFVPMLAGFFVSNAYNRIEWTSFWVTTATIMTLSGLFFLTLGETKPQDFSLDERELNALLELKEQRELKKNKKRKTRDATITGAAAAATSTTTSCGGAPPTAAPVTGTTTTTAAATTARLHKSKDLLV